MIPTEIPLFYVKHCRGDVAEEQLLKFPTVFLARAGYYEGFIRRYIHQSVPEDSL